MHVYKGIRKSEGAGNDGIGKTFFQYFKHKAQVIIDLKNSLNKKGVNFCLSETRKTCNNTITNENIFGLVLRVMRLYTICNQHYSNR